jgi:3-hydroxymyristoyl/3-hydroxydecanoyl-(acyl carrier protein) dehydratase
MSLDRFSAFSFVDRITSTNNYGEINGSFKIPDHLDFFPHSLVAEAIGQLAAWYAMSKLNFTSRPVAALAGQINYHGEVYPGETLSLAAKIDSCDSDSVTYSGLAVVGERLILELMDCTGAMLPQEEFDDSKIVEKQFKLLETIGAKENRLAVVPCIQGTNLHADAIGTLEACLIIPDQADFFTDHFPNKPVFPATLLMYALTSMVMEKINNRSPQSNILNVNISAMRRVKVRSWIAPGEHVSLRAEFLPTERNPKSVKLTANHAGKLVASALLELAAKVPPQAE